MTGTSEELRDQLLVLGCLEGRADAFRALVARFEEPLWRHAFRLTGREDVAWDVLQDAWIAIANGIQALTEPSRFRGWAYTIVTRRAVDRMRRERPASEWDETAEAVAVNEADEPSDAVELLRRALRRVSGERKALLSLRYVDGFEVAEIARILELPEGTVKSRLHHAREELRAIIERLER